MPALRAIPIPFPYPIGCSAFCSQLLAPCPIYCSAFCSLINCCVPQSLPDLPRATQRGGLCYRLATPCPRAYQEEMLSTGGCLVSILLGVTGMGLHLLGTSAWALSQRQVPTLSFKHQPETTLVKHWGRHCCCPSLANSDDARDCLCICPAYTSAVHGAGAGTQRFLS